MSKATPGPWYAVGAWVEVADDDIPDICSCDPAILCQAHLGRSDEEVFANARLIASAPELLAALERTEEFLRGDPLADALMREGGITLGEYIRAALSKARGE